MSLGVFSEGSVISPDNAPVLSRWLIKKASYSSGPIEVTVLEWSPSGRAVRLAYALAEARRTSVGITGQWTDDIPLIFEQLPPIEDK